jgi:DNA-binding protein H-NS
MDGWVANGNDRFAATSRLPYTGDSTLEKEAQMARPKSLSKMSLDSLIELRDNVTAAIGEQAEALRKQLASLTGGTVDGGGKRRARPPGRRGSKLKGRTIAAKYRSKKDPKLTWAGRGATPRWMRDEMKARKLKKEAFLIK